MNTDQIGQKNHTNQIGQKDHKNHTGRSIRLWRRILLGLCIFAGIGALGGGVLAVVAPDGSLLKAQELIPVLQAIPIIGQYLDSLLIPGCALLLFVFLPQILASALLRRKHPRQYFVASIGGALVVIVTTVELIVLGLNVLSWVFLFYGFVEIVVGLYCSRRSHLLD